MEGAHKRLFEITQHVQGDPLGNALMDDVLMTCFDLTLGNGDALERLVMALNRFNHQIGAANRISESSPIFMPGL